MKNVTIKRSRFFNNLSSSESAGWAIGLANVQSCDITNNTLDGYAMNGIHIEDRSAKVTILNNTFIRTSITHTVYHSHVFIISGSNDITITGNVFDTRAQTNAIDCVYVGAGGSSMQPHDVTVIHNTAYLANGSQMVGIYAAYNVTTEPNTIQVE